MTALRQSWQVYMRGVRVLARQPAYLGVTLTQPIIWLLLFGALFKSVSSIPGFHALLLLIAALLAATFASLSNAVGVLGRQRETVIGAVTLVQLPLTFLSAALMQRNLLPAWIRAVAELNPVNWAVEAGRSAAMQQIDWGLVAGRIGLLAALLVAAGAIAGWAFARYQRSL